MVSISVAPSDSSPVGSSRPIKSSQLHCAITYRQPFMDQLAGDCRQSSMPSTSVHEIEQAIAQAVAGDRFRLPLGCARFAPRGLRTRLTPDELERLSQQVGESVKRRAAVKPLCRSSATSTICRSGRNGTRFRRRSASTRLSSSVAKPGRANPRSCPRSVWKWGAASTG